MSIATQIIRLLNIKVAIRQSLVNKGVTSASTHDMDDFATDIGNIPTGGTYQSKTVSPSTSQQIVSPDSGYDALSQVTVNAMNLQTKSVHISPSADWSSAWTSATAISPDSGKDGMTQVNVQVPMCRDNMLMTASAVSTPSTVYNGDTAQSNSQKLLRIESTKSGMVYTNSYLYVQPNSYLGNATAADVASGKTFSSANGIQVTGTGGGSTPTGNINLGTISSNGTKTGYNVSGYATCSFTVQVPTGMDTSDATAYASDILASKTAYARGSKITGSITTRSASSETLNAGTSKTYYSGYYPNNWTVTAENVIIEDPELTKLYISSSVITSTSTTHSVTIPTYGVVLIALRTSNTQMSFADGFVTASGSTNDVMGVYIENLSYRVFESSAYNDLGTICYRVSSTNITAKLEGYYNGSNITTIRVTFSTIPSTTSYRTYLHVYKLS